MKMMFRYRRPVPQSALQPRFRFIRTVQAPDQVVLDERTGLYRFSSAAFGPSSSDGTLSGDLEQLLIADGLAADALYPSVLRAVGAASLTIEQIRSQNLEVFHDPVSNNWYHGAVRGLTGKKKEKNKLRDLAAEFVRIDQDEAARLDPRTKTP